jgi:hypothetical protein
MMQAVCFGLIESFEIEEIQNAIFALGFNCLFLVIMILQINMLVMCVGLCGESKFDEKEFKHNLNSLK